MSQHRRLRRLDAIWISPAIYFVTLCAAQRRPIFANPGAFSILLAEFSGVSRRSGWRIGRFVVMPDHVHFFCASEETPTSATLSRCVGAIKQWTAKSMAADFGLQAPIWQKQFFDHLLRTRESYENKWRYVYENPVRAGLAARAADWPYAGEIDILER